MKRIKSTTMPSGKWTIGKIEELVKVFVTFGKSKDMQDAENMSIAFALVEAEYDNKKLTLKETKELISAFNKARSWQRNAIKKYLILEALLTSIYVINVKIVREDKTEMFETYRCPATNFMGEPISSEKDKVDKIGVYSLFEKSYLGVPKVTGKVRTGLCQCCRDYEVDKIEVKKILDLRNIFRIDLQAYDLIITLD